jgi:7-cyano-7-deazaguanine synthase
MGEQLGNAIVLLSGGLDSATTLAIAKAKGFQIHALSFRYGQRHQLELEAAQRVAAAFRVKQHIVLDIDLRRFGGSALTADIPVPKDRRLEQMSDGIPVTYVPARNTIFLSYALAWAEVLPSTDIFIGVNALDFSGYPDCRPDFVESFQLTANLGTRLGTELHRRIRIHAPLIELTKAQIIREGLRLGVDYSTTLTCYDPTADGEACGACDSCKLRLKGFAELGRDDPVSYRA